jgi:general secretion pathway protein I
MLKLLFKNRILGSLIQRPGHAVFRALNNSLKPGGGFTLIETLVAVMVLAISLVVILQLFSGGLKANQVSSDYLYGIFHAKEKMEEVLLSSTLVPGTSSGEFDDGYGWVVVVDPVAVEEEVETRMPFDAFNIWVDVSWKNGERSRHFEIYTTALAQRPENQG